MNGAGVKMMDATSDLINKAEEIAKQAPTIWKRGALWHVSRLNVDQIGSLGFFEPASPSGEAALSTQGPMFDKERSFYCERKSR